MTDPTRCPDPADLLVLLYDDEGDPADRAALEAHLNRCASCAEVMQSLNTTRGALGAWHAPRLPLGFAFVRTPERSRTATVLWRGGLAAAAVLVLAAASSLAQLRISYDQSGFSVSTGAVQAPRPAAAAPLAGVSSPAAEATAVPAPPQAWVDAATKADAPWRADIELLATQLRGELTRLAEESRRTQPAAVAMRVAVPAAAPAAGRSMTDEELLRRVQDLLDQSEVRQQQNLALRVTELGRQFELVRQADIVQMEQTLTRIEQQRSELLRRVASTQPRP